MAHSKRGRPKNARAGCLMCKPHKANGAKGMTVHQARGELRGRLEEREQLQELARDPLQVCLEEERLTRELSWARGPRLERDLTMRTRHRQRVVDGE